MKKIVLTILTILILTACSGVSSALQLDSDKLNDSYENALPVSTQLIIGTFQLEETEFAITSEQAAGLIPLWQVFQSLSESDSAAQAEIDALTDQIQEVMTAQQIQAIKEMQLTQQEMFATLQEKGAVGQDGQGITQNSGSDRPAEGGSFPRPADGGVPGAGPGGGFGDQGQGLTPDQIATAQAARQERSGGFLPPMLMNTFIEFLQEKAGS